MRRIGMPINYSNNADCRLRVLEEVKDLENICGRYRVSVTDLINLCGGIPTSNFALFKIDGTSYSTDVFEIEIEADSHKVSRVLDFKNHIIHNSYLRVFQRNIGVGTALFLNQVKSARAIGFSRLETHAAGGEDYEFDSDWDGYHWWAKVGYIMDEQSTYTFQL